MRAQVVGFVAALFILAGPVLGQSEDIQGVITNQIEAFKKDDFETAFTFAHPSIQGMFRTPENFGRMVTQGYPMVWRPAEVEYLSLRENGPFLFQDVQITDSAGRVFVLEYSMTLMPDGWRISGVRVLESSVVAT